MSTENLLRRLRIIDSHTGGEPTRVVLEGGPDLGGGSMRERRERLSGEHDWLRSAVVNEPRGSDAVVGALLCAPEGDEADAGVLFFNNTGYLHMCVHGTIGLVETLAYLGRYEGDRPLRLDTPAGRVTATRESDGMVTVANVPSYRQQANVRLTVDGFGEIGGDIAWGGNWFFLVQDHEVEVSHANLKELTAFCEAVRRALAREGLRGEGDMEIDHIEVFAPAEGIEADSRNFVLCPGGAYDRSPCGTGTSAKAACLHAEGRLRPGQIWRQAGIVGSVFEAYCEETADGKVIPYIRGRAYVNGEATLILDPRDPFRHGISDRTIV